jgi:hypothetical protein
MPLIVTVFVAWRKQPRRRIRVNKRQVFIAHLCKSVCDRNQGYRIKIDAK